MIMRMMMLIILLDFQIITSRKLMRMRRGCWKFSSPRMQGHSALWLILLWRKLKKKIKCLQVCLQEFNLCPNWMIQSSRYIRVQYMQFERSCYYWNLEVFFKKSIFHHFIPVWL